MTTVIYSPQLFIKSVSTIDGKLVGTAHEVREFKQSMSTAAGLLNTAIASVNSEVTGNNNSITKKELRTCRESFMTILAKSTSFLDKFNTFLRYADMDDTSKDKIVNSVSKGDYKSFSSYISQLVCYLDQLDKKYQSFVQACTETEVQCKGIPNGFEAQSSLMEHGATPSQSSTTPGLYLGAGVVTFGVSSLLLGFGIPTCIAIGIGTSLIFVAGSHFVNAATRSESMKNKPLKIQYQGYNSVRSSASHISSSSHNVRTIIISLSAERAVGEHVDIDSFSSALDTLLAEVRKAHDIVNQYEELNREITVIRMNSF